MTGTPPDGVRSRPLAGRRILVVDDDAQCLRLVAMRLTAAGADVVTAASGSEGLASFEQQRPDLVVSDVLLPGIDGFELARRIKQDPATEKVPVVLLSAFYVSDEDAAQGLRVGAERYLVKPDVLLAKPVEGDLLLHNVLSLLEGEQGELAADPRARVLAVDDDHASLRLLRYRLEAEAYAVTTVATGQEALARVDASTFDAVLLDVEMPGLGGLPVLESLRARHPDLPVVMITAYGSERIAVEAMRRGANDYVSKPLDFGVLFAVLKEIVERGRLKRQSRRLEERLVETSQDLFSKIQALEEANRKLLESNQRIAQAERLKSEFLANMSHELRTPLNAILGFSRLVIEGGGERLTEGMREDLEAIHGCGEHLLALIDDLLDMARIEAGTMELRLESFDLREVVLAVKEILGSLVPRGDVELSTLFADDLPPVLADRRRVRQVLLNLGGNAAKFTQSGAITLRAVVGAGKEGASQVLVTVEDTGAGIPTEEHRRIFERFRQLEEDPKRSRGGAGLGLAIAKELVELQQGILWVDSSPGRGASFTFTLPIAPAEPDAGVA